MRDFLDFVTLPGGFIEIRAIRDGKVRQWWEEDRQAACDLALSLSDEGWDAYYGVLPRKERSGVASAVVPFTRTLWADLDAKVHMTKRQALMALIDLDIPPSVVVDSGHGYHAYWRLEELIMFDEAKPMMVGLARALRGDHVYDRPRILRIPGTTNWKDPAEPKPVRTVVFDTTREHKPASFHRYADIGIRELNPPPPKPTKHIPAEHREDLPDWLDELIRDGAPQGQRSEQAFKVMCHLAKRGYTDDEIHRAFETGGIGDKMREMRTGGERWFNRSLSRARRDLR
jgi:hypothetical protein